MRTLLKTKTLLAALLLLGVPWVPVAAQQDGAGEAPSQSVPPLAEDPAAEDPAAEDPAAEDPAAEEPADEQPGDEQPGDEKPGDEQPGDEQPGDEQPADEGSLPEGYSCMACHSKDGDFHSEDMPVVTEEHLAGDVHWQEGLRCHDCHGGNPVLDDYVDHRDDETFLGLDSAGDLVAFCGRCHEEDLKVYRESVHHGSGAEIGATCVDCHGTHHGMVKATDQRSTLHPVNVVSTCGDCHANVEYMRKFRPSPRTDQLAEYWTSGHGIKLKESQDLEVATCVSCHCLKEHKGHAIRPVNDMGSPVYPTNLAETCQTCHSDAEKMAGRQYHGKELGHGQYDAWKQSVHAQALLKDGDLSAPTCNDCHGNHGAVPPDVDSVANACGACHAKVAGLFENTSMKHRFEEADWEGLPGCTACHSNHQILSPTDEMLGVTTGAVCAACHEKKLHGATELGSQTAQALRAGIEQLKQQIAEAEQKVAEAERLGMEVRGPRFDLHQAENALVNARSLIHTFTSQPVEEALAEGRQVSSDVAQRAEAKLWEHTYRRIWLAVSLVPISIVVVLLLLYIRRLPLPAK